MTKFFALFVLFTAIRVWKNTRRYRMLSGQLLLAMKCDGAFHKVISHSDDMLKTMQHEASSSFLCVTIALHHRFLPQLQNCNS
ncbi:hypothetical protein BES08_27430 (plasmid) [Novosphingobium resinovorum]|uniref:Uncharacterized protein n=1 Tax=Novosphingobium resinovorum TaxID=158500 RepID=A0A1D8AEN8_9SPHN|nr:hypothetical protein BES08_27430 [Novosphingobium resinovorum]